MRAAVFHGAGQPLTVEDVQIQKPQRNEVLIRVAFAGLCHSDLHFMEGLYPFPTPAVLGHEGAGVVEAVGEDVTYVKPGDHVVTCMSVFCGGCDFCISGRPYYCDDTTVKLPTGTSQRLSWKGKQLHQFYNTSTFAELMLVHEHALVKIAKEMPLDRAALIGCAVITGVGSVFNTAKVEPGSTVAVIGCGGIGLSVVNGAILAGAARVIAIDAVAEKLEVARALGASDAINIRDGDPVEQVRELTAGGVTYAFECVGTKKTAEQSFAMLERGGLSTLIGMIPYGTQIELHGAQFLDGRRIQGSEMGSNRFRLDVPRYVEFYRQGRLKLDHMLDSQIPLDQINEGYAIMKKGNALRQVIDFAL